MNEYTLVALGIDIGIIYYLYTIYGAHILQRKKIKEIFIITFSIILTISNTLLSATDTVTLLVSTVTALAIGLMNHLLLVETLDSEQINELPITKRIASIKNRLLR